MRSSAALLALVLAVAPVPSGGAAPVAIRYNEAITHGFLVMKGPRGNTIAHGEFVQHPQGERVHNQLIFRFADGSLYEEAVTFTQRRVFRLMSYKLVQKGPSFPEASEVSFDRDSGRYRARAGKDTSEGKLDLPEDAYNGMLGVLLKNVPPSAGATGQIVAFTPKPHLVRATMVREGEDKYFVGEAPHTATRWLVKLELEGVKGVVASLIGKDPPDVRFWIATGTVPGFVKFEGAIFLKGPRWRVELSSPGWPDAASGSAPRGSGRRS